MMVDLNKTHYLVQKMIKAEEEFINEHGGLQGHIVNHQRGIVFFECVDGEYFNCTFADFE